MFLVGVAERAGFVVVTGFKTVFCEAKLCFGSTRPVESFYVDRQERHDDRERFSYLLLLVNKSS